MNDDTTPTREKHVEAARAAFVETFGCRDDEIEALAGALSEAGLRDLSLTLRQIRAAPSYQRSTMALALPFVLANDDLPTEKIAPALAAAKAIIARFPEAPPPGAGPPPGRPSG
jgi:hypothetical protein